jgi:hypothetical protein
VSALDMARSRMREDPDFLREFENLLVTGPKKLARRRLYAAYRAEPDPDVRRWMREVLLPRLNEPSKAPVKTRKPKARPRPRPDNATCRLCRQGFHRPETDTRTVCDICAPSRSSSLRTVSGGLPSLGRRR